MRYERQQDVAGPRLLAGMTTRELNKLVDGATAIELPARKMLISEGHRPTFLHILTEGTAELFIRRGRRELCVAVVERDTPFVLAAVVKDAPYLMSARTVTDARVLCIPASQFRASMRRDSRLAQATTDAMSDAYRAVVRQLRSHRLSSAQMRLARYLVELKHEDPGAGSVHLDVSKRRLAALLGLKPESLSRVFASLAEYGVHVDGEHITVTDFKLLEDLAQPDSDIDRE